MILRFFNDFSLIFVCDFFCDFKQGVRKKPRGQKCTEITLDPGPFVEMLKRYISVQDQKILQCSL